MNSARGGARHGFTLLEMLIVLVIMGLLATVVLTRLTGNVEESKVKTTRMQIQMLSSSVEQFYLHVGRYPTEEEGLGVLLDPPVDVEDDKWRGPYLEKDFVPTDAWGREFTYRFNDRGRFVIRSLGADGSEGGEGDASDLDNRSA